MSLRDRIEDVPDAALEQALKNFRSSVHAWSEAAYSRPRTAVSVVRHRSWQLAASCALGCALVAGSMTGVVHERHHRQFRNGGSEVQNRSVHGNQAVRFFHQAK